MKTKVVMFAALVALGHLSIQSAIAQSSSTTINTASSNNASAVAPSSTSSAAPSTASTASNASVATVNSNTGIRPAIRYLAIAKGPGLEFSRAGQNDIFGNPEFDNAFDIDHRPSFGVALKPNMILGVEARFITTFASSKMDISNGNSRVFFNMKNLYKDDIMSFGLMPRIVLPTSNSAHNQLATFSPEIIASYSLNPKDTRFSFSAGLQVIQHLYSERSAANDRSRQTTLAGWAEVDYQISPTVQAFASYWPDLRSTRSQQTITEAGHEVDLGAYIQVAKQWTVAPFIATEFQGFKMAQAEKNMQLNFLIIGTVL